LVNPGWRSARAPIRWSNSPVATRVVAYSSRNDLARLCQVSQLWQRVAQRELERRRCCPIAKHGLLAGHPEPRPTGSTVGCPYAELAKRFGLLLHELRADWHLPYRLLAFCDVEFLRAKLAATAGGMAEAELGSPPCQTEQEREQTPNCHQARDSTWPAASPAPSHPEGTAGVPVEMETGKSSDVRQMHPEPPMKPDRMLGSISSRLVFYGDRLRVLSAMADRCRGLGEAGHRDRGVFSRLLPGVLQCWACFLEGEFSRNCSPGGAGFADVAQPPLGLRAYRTSLCVLS
uniref:F-box domain-containing protein n=1 Tax=Macrostomum lignano TaxID=282301 RepID=A0A1I8FIB8_9PLAT